MHMPQSVLERINASAPHPAQQLRPEVVKFQQQRAPSIADRALVQVLAEQLLDTAWCFGLAVEIKHEPLQTPAAGFRPVITIGPALGVADNT